MKRIKTPPTPPEVIEVGDYSLTKYDTTHSITRWTPRGYSVLNEEHSLGIIEGVEVWIGLAYGYNQCPDPTDPTHAKWFRDYTKEELTRYKTYWDSGIMTPWYRYKKNLHDKQRWGFTRVVLASFVNGIQIGDHKEVEDWTEVGYAPSLNANDFGDPIYLDETGTIRNWVENNQATIKKFAEDRRLVALEFIGDTLKKLTK